VYYSDIESRTLYYGDSAYQELLARRLFKSNLLVFQSVWTPVSDFTTFKYLDFSVQPRSWTIFRNTVEPKRAALSISSSDIYAVLVGLVFGNFTWVLLVVPPPCIAVKQKFRLYFGSGVHKARIFLCSRQIIFVEWICIYTVLGYISLMTR
jgi:hypothetical protein